MRSSKGTDIVVVGVALTVTLVSMATAQLPDPGMKIDSENTAMVITDPQNDFLSPEGVTWGVVGESVTDNKTVENIETLFKASKSEGIPVFISPHDYYPADHGWKFERALEKLMHNIGMFDRKDSLSLEGFEGSGAYFLVYKPYIQDRKTVIASPTQSLRPRSSRSPRSPGGGVTKDAGVIRRQGNF